MNMIIPEWLLKETFVVQHNPNCPKPFLVRLCGYCKGKIDLKPYMGPEPQTHDALGGGLDIEEAALNAKLAVIKQKREQRK